MSDEAEIRAVLSVAKLEALTEDVLASGMAIAETRKLAMYVMAYLDQAVEGVLPDMSPLSGMPPRVVEKAKGIVANAVAEAVAHRPPKGRPN